MLICEHIEQHAQQISPLIDRQNYRAVAQKIQPGITMAPTERGSLRRAIPEWHEYRRGQS